MRKLCQTKTVRSKRDDENPYWKKKKRKKKDDCQHYDLKKKNVCFNLTSVELYIIKPSSIISGFGDLYLSSKSQGCFTVRSDLIMFRFCMVHVWNHKLMIGVKMTAVIINSRERCNLLWTGQKT